MISLLSKFHPARLLYEIMILTCLSFFFFFFLGLLFPAWNKAIISPLHLLRISWNPMLSPVRNSTLYFVIPNSIPKIRQAYFAGKLNLIQRYVNLQWRDRLLRQKCQKHLILKTEVYKSQIITKKKKKKKKEERERERERAQATCISYHTPYHGPRLYNFRPYILESKALTRAESYYHNETLWRRPTTGSFIQRKLLQHVHVNLRQGLWKTSTSHWRKIACNLLWRTRRLLAYFSFLRKKSEQKTLIAYILQSVR